MAISLSIAGLLRKAGLDPYKIYVVKSAFKPAGEGESVPKQELKRELAQQFGINPDINWIGNTGALTEQKDYRTFLRTLAKLKKTGIGFQALIAGVGHLKNDLEKEVLSYNLENEVFFIGFHKEVRRVYRSLDIFFMPSAYEGLGTSLLEAMDAGCSIVASRVGGIPETIPRGLQEQCLAIPGDCDHFVHLLTRQLEDHHLRAEQNAKLRSYISQEFSAGSMISGNIEVYQRVLSKDKVAR